MGPVLLGALLTIVATVTIQWFVIPRVDQRKRRDARWEEQLVSLGELLTGAASRARYDVLCRAADFLEGRDKDAAGLNLALDAYADIGVRADWLTRRIVGAAPRASRLVPFARASAVWLAEVDNAGREVRSLAQGDSDFQLEPLISLMDEAHEFQRAKELVDEVDRLLQGRPLTALT
jgi:hypothetical protein